MGKLLDAFKADLEKNRKDQTITEVMIIDTDSRKSTASTVGRGLVGGALFGGIGLVAGAATARNKKETSFRITYESGRMEVKTCKNGSREYNKYIKMI